MQTLIYKLILGKISIKQEGEIKNSNNLVKFNHSKLEVILIYFKVSNGGVILFVSINNNIFVKI